MPLRVRTIFALAVLSLGSAEAADPAAVQGSTFSVSASTRPPETHSGWRLVPNTAFAAGEDYFYEVKWGVITGGHSTLTIVGLEPVDGRPAFHIQSDAKSVGVVDTFFKVNDRNETWLDLTSLTTVRYEKHIREGKYRIEETGMIDQVLHKFVVQSYRIDKNRYEDKKGEVTPNVLDVLGALYYVRTLPLEVGQTYTFDVFSPKRIWPLEVKVHKKERVKVPAGKFNCILVEPYLREPGIFVAKGKKLQVWLTDDARRMPVKMRSEVVIGHVSADLVRYKHVSPQ
jgi:hypothetical protein